MLTKDEQKQFDKLLEKQKQPLKLFGHDVRVKDGEVHIGCKYFPIESFKLLTALVCYYIKRNLNLRMELNSGAKIQVSNNSIEYRGLRMDKQAFLNVLEQLDLSI